MSFSNFQKTVEKDDTVILYLTINQIYSVLATDKIPSKKGILVDNVFQTPFGALRCADLVGKSYGSKIDLSKGWGYILQPNPELWTLTLPHRTQIIYTPDASMIILQLELKPNSIIIESGTGSGSLSHAIIRTIKPHGHLHTFDFHEQRVQIVEQEFKEHGLSKWVTVKHRDVCKDGFGEELQHVADAVFLDLPDPWLALSHAISCLKKTGGRICSFSPCIEQVQKTCSILAKLGFREVQTMEVLQTQYSVHTRTSNVMNFDFLRTKKQDTDEKQEKETAKNIVCSPPTTQPGHTGYLTFATLFPL